MATQCQLLNVLPIFAFFSLTEQAEAQERQEEAVRSLKEELEKKQVLSFCTEWLYIAKIGITHSIPCVLPVFAFFSLAEQAEAQERQEEVVRGLKEELNKT